jgi:hypothetical protein
MLNATATALDLQVLWKEPEDHHAVAVPRHDGTPGKIRNPGQTGQLRLNGKLRPAELQHQLRQDWPADPCALPW